MHIFNMHIFDMHIFDMHIFDMHIFDMLIFDMHIFNMHIFNMHIFSQEPTHIGKGSLTQHEMHKPSSFGADNRAQNISDVRCGHHHLMHGPRLA